VQVGGLVLCDTPVPEKEGIVRRVSSAAGLIVAAATVALAAACGGGDSPDSTGTDEGPGQNGGGNNAFAAYAQCLQQNGVTITMPSAGVRNRPSGGFSRGPDGNRPSGMPRPSGSGFPRGGGGFPGGMGMQKPADVDQATWDKAQAACAAQLPSGRPGGNRDNGANAAYRNCLRDHGVAQNGGQPDANDETVKKAQEACQVLRPQPSATPSA
jgi:hypothetical protein